MAVQVKWGAPGTGKTHVLKKIFIEHGLENAILTTFSRSTADDIKFDIAMDMDIAPETLKHSINTIHGTCYQLLGGPSYAKVVDSKKIKEFNKETGYNFKVSKDTPEPDNGSGVYDAYTWQQNTQTPLEVLDDYPNFRRLNIAPTDAREQIKHYCEWKEQNGLIDFADMLSTVLKSGLVPDVDMLLIDEFQDLTALQNKIFSMWCESIDNVVVAGDPLQSIYGFMGGSPDYFLKLDGIKEVIPHSYRLSKTVWDYAVEVATDAGMKTPNIETAQHEGKIKHISYRDYVNDVSGWEGTPEYEVYHLVRSRYQAPAICKVLAENGIIWKGLNGWSEAQLTLLNAVVHARTGRPLYKPHLRALIEVYPQTHFNYIGNKSDLLEHVSGLENAELSGHACGLITPTLYIILNSANPTTEWTKGGKTTRLKIANALKKHTSPVYMHKIGTKVLTVHASKGLDANRVYLHTEISKNTKKAMRLDSAAEARVFYVGITRAINELIIVKDKGSNYYLPQGAA